MTNSMWDKYWSDSNNHDWWERPAPGVVEFIESLSPELTPVALDLGCGLGRHAIAFAKKGFQVTATDDSQQAIDYLQRWAKDLDLSITTHVCSMLDHPLHPSSFDIVLSYNVIYHGLRSQFVEAIREVWKLLKTSGLFFFTCPTRKDGKYGHGECVEPHTYSSTKSVIPGDIHYFTDEAELQEILTGFTIRSMRRDEGYWSNKGEQQFFSNLEIVAEKIKDNTNKTNAADAIARR